MKKICTKCGKPKDLEGFHKNKNCKDGRSGECKTCRATYDASPEVKARQAAYEISLRGKVRQATYRASPKGKAHDVAYRATPEVKARQVTFNAMAIKTLSNYYIKSKLRRMGVETNSITPEMIELKRELILMHRGIKEINDGINGAKI